MARVLAIVPDLMLSSRVAESLTAAGHEVEVSSALPEAPLVGVELLVADLDAVEPRSLTGRGVPVLGFYSHVDVDTRSAAEAAGLDLVIPRSRMSRELPQLAEQLLKNGSG
jgi:hypothetical protein